MHAFQIAYKYTHPCYYLNIRNYISQQMKKKAERKKTIAEYEIYLDKRLGGGSYGQVYRGLDKKTNEQVAIKMIEKGKIHDKNQQYMINALKRQTLILSKINSENVVAFKDILATKNYYYIVQQLCNGDLQGYLAKNPKVPEKKAIQFMAMILKGFYNLILTNVIHRDIKPANILIKNEMLKIADFGFSRKINQNKLMTSAVGTKAYCSPQILGQSSYTSKADIWSLGVLFYQMLYATLPFKNLGQIALKKECEDFEFPMKPQVSEETQLIIRKCLKYNEEDRADWDYLFSHPYFNDKVPSLKHLDKKLSYIISVIREQTYVKNIDLQKFFKMFGFEKNKEINYKQYEKMIKKLVPEGKLKNQQILYSFNIFDEDKSEKISFNQFQKTLQKHGLQMNAASRQWRNRTFIGTDIKNQDEEGNDIANEENLTHEETILLQATQNAYKKLIQGLNEKKFEDLQEKYNVKALISQGLEQKEFIEFVQNELEQKLTQKQCELIFQKFDDDRNGILQFSQFYDHIFRQINIPTRMSFYKKQSQNQQR